MLCEKIILLGGVEDLLHYFFDISCVFVCLLNMAINVGITQGEEEGLGVMYI